MSVVEALDVLLEGLSWLLLDAAQVTRSWLAVTSALEVGDEAVAHLVPGGDRAVLQVQEPGAGSILQSHGKPVLHDFLIAVGCFEAQLVELQELRGVGGAVVARRQIRFELAWLGDATQLGGEGTAANRGSWGPLRRWSFVRTPIPSHIDLAGNTSYHFVASRTVFPRVLPYHGPGPFAPFGSRI